MLRRRVVVRAENGAHARPVAELARLALAHDAAVRLSTADGRVVDATSILAVMNLAIAAGDEVVLETADSPAGAAVLAQMCAVLAE